MSSAFNFISIELVAIVQCMRFSAYHNMNVRKTHSQNELISASFRPFHQSPCATLCDHIYTGKFIKMRSCTVCIYATYILAYIQYIYAALCLYCDCACVRFPIPKYVNGTLTARNAIKSNDDRRTAWASDRFTCELLDLRLN